MMGWRVTASGLEMRIRLTPKSSADRIEGLAPFPAGMVLKARVRAAPEDGKANDALERLLAVWLDVPRRTVTVTAGSKSRLKTILVAGNGAALAASADRALAETFQS